MGILCRYVLDREKHRNPSLPNRLTKRGFFCIFILLLQLAPVLRYVDALNYALKSKKAEKERDVENQRKYYKLMVQEDSDVALLRVLECFLEAAPQQILQLSIIFHTHGQGITNTLTCMCFNCLCLSAFDVCLTPGRRRLFCFPLLQSCTSCCP